VVNILLLVLVAFHKNGGVQKGNWFGFETDDFRGSRFLDGCYFLAAGLHPCMGSNVDLPSFLHMSIVGLIMRLEPCLQSII
jgi:hypothetical protein